MENCAIILGFCLIEQNLSFDRSAYEIVRNSILKHLLAYGAMTTQKLGSLVESHLKYKFDGSLYKHYEAVRQDLVSRGEIRLIPKTHPQLVEIVR